MRVGFLGLGRLGLPIAAVLSQHHEVTGYDPAPSTAQRLEDGHPWEEGLEELLNGRIRLVGSPDAATADADVIVVCVPTPHGPGLDGTTDTDERAPFDLSSVQTALGSFSSSAPVVLMSTVLPGDCRRLAQLCAGPLIYAPAFPAMGTVIADVLEPEFILTGSETLTGMDRLVELWGKTLQKSPRWFTTDWETAELAKMAYNTAIGMKLALANTVGWLAEEVGADGDKVMRILGSAHRRITSPAYLSPGLGDGGACHPRDQIALSWLSQKNNVYDLFGHLINQRSAHSQWIASIARRESQRTGLEVVILGAAYKADSPLTDGSPALLLADQTGWPIVERPPTEPSVIVIGVPHSRYQSMDFTNHVVIDCWGIVPGAIHAGRSQ